MKKSKSVVYTKQTEAEKQREQYGLGFQNYKTGRVSYVTRNNNSYYTRATSDAYRHIADKESYPFDND